MADLRARLADRRLMLLAEVSRIDRAIAALDGVEALLNGTAPPISAPSPLPVRGEAPEAIVSAAVAVLGAVGRPLTRGRLLRELQARGIEVGGRDKAKNLGTILWRHPELFANVPGRGYVLVLKAAEPARYREED